MIIFFNANFIMNDFYDLNRLPKNGTIVMPLSQSKLHTSQNPKSIYEFLEFFSTKIKSISVDVVFLYTNSLYQNNNGNSHEIKLKTTNQMTRHKLELSKLITDWREYTPQAFHFLPWDYIILNTDVYIKFLTALNQLFRINREFQNIVESDLHNITSKPNISFILEELVITHIIRQNYVKLPKTLATESGWRLVAYNGPCLKSDVYLLQNAILPINQTLYDRRYTNCLYDYQANCLIHLDRIKTEKFYHV